MLPASFQRVLQVQQSDIPHSQQQQGSANCLTTSQPGPRVAPVGLWRDTVRDEGGAAASLDLFGCFINSKSPLLLLSGLSWPHTHIMAHFLRVRLQKFKKAAIMVADQPEELTAGTQAFKDRVLDSDLEAGVKTVSMFCVTNLVFMLRSA